MLFTINELKKGLPELRTNEEIKEELDAILKKYNDEGRSPELKYFNAAREIWEQIAIPRQEWTENTLITAAAIIKRVVEEKETGKDMFDPA